MAWSLATAERKVCVRIQPTPGDVESLWSHPLSPRFPIGAARDVVLPVRPPGTTEGPSTSSASYARRIQTLLGANSAWELEGTRVARRIKHFHTWVPCT